MPTLRLRATPCSLHSKAIPSRYSLSARNHEYSVRHLAGSVSRWPGLNSGASSGVYSIAAMSHRTVRFLLLQSLMLANTIAFCQDRVSAALDSLPTVRKIDDVAISPDGSQVAYIVEGQLSVAAVSDGTSHSIAADHKMSARDITWSADSRHIAWLSDLSGDKPAAELWTASPGSADLTRLADLKGYAENPRYSPDGSKLSVLYIEDMPRIAGPLQPMTPLAGVVGEKIFEQRIAVIDLATRTLSQVSPSDVYVYEY